MSRKNRTRTARTADSGTGEVRPLRSVPDPASKPPTAARTAAEDKLWEALHANPGTTSELSSAAGIGKSTAAKILVRWAGDGSVTRTPGIPGGGRRTADRWSITDALPDVGTEPEEAIGPRDTSPATATSAVATPAEFADAPDGATTTVDGLPETVDVNGDPDGDAVVKATRLAPGALRGLVEDYLRDHPADQFSPSKIGKALDRSAGAVNNALEKLVQTGSAVQTNDAPKRFAIGPTSDDAAPAAAVE